MRAVAAPLTRLTATVVVLAGVSACAREDEAGMRARLAAWVALGETRHFAAQAGCAAGLFGLVDTGMKAAMPVAGSVPGMLRALQRHGRAALDDAGQPPDAALVALVDADRVTGYAVRRAALEARACMDDATEGALRAALTSDAAVLAFDGDSGTAMLLDRDTGVMVATMGAR
jgi:hypothetical protein